MIPYHDVFQPMKNDYVPSEELGFFDLGLKYFRQVNARIWLAWTPEIDGESTIALAINTNGWLGFGVSETGGMIAAEICAFWETGGQVTAYTMWAHNYTTPTMSTNQHCRLLNYTRLSSSVESMVVFTRNTISCKPQGVDLYSEWDNRFIFAFGDSQIFSYHMQNVGMSEFNFHLGPKPVYELPPDTIKQGAYMARREIPAVKDDLICRAGKFPGDRRYHVVKVSPYFPNVIEPAQHHHLNYFHCKNAPGGWPPYYADGEQKECMNPLGLECIAYFYSWLMGQGDDYYMEHGLPIGADGGAEYFVMQAHIHNPFLDSGIIDDGWGLDFFYTPTLRDSECGNVGFLQWLPTQGILPGVKNTTLFSDCGDSCTDVMIPPTGTYVIAVAPHMHRVGVEIGVQHFRKSNETGVWQQLPDIHRLKHWDPLWQGYRHRREGIALLPGDYIRMYCTYDSTNWTEPVYGGEGYDDEMCMMPIMMAPRLQATGCFSMDLGVLPDVGGHFCVLDDPIMVAPIDPDFSFIQNPEEPQNCPVSPSVDGKVQKVSYYRV
jgi:hypothetical protein